MNISKTILRWVGWKVDISTPDFPKCIICVAPHTTNWDFFLCELAYRSIGRKAGFLMKKSWFFFPLNIIFKSMGGIAVERKNKSVSLTQVIIDKFNASTRMVIAITPEGTRSRVSDWHTGFLRIAYQANIPVVLGVIDGGEKRLLLKEVFIATGDTDADMRRIKDYYSAFTAIYPERFTTE